MQIFQAIDLKYGFGRLFNLVRAALAGVSKQGQPIVLAAVNEFERPKSLDIHIAGRAGAVLENPNEPGGS